MTGVFSLTNLREHIANCAKTHGSQAALISCSAEGSIVREVSYKELDKTLDAAAAYLLGLGLKQGDRVALAFGNSPELLILSWAAWCAGIVTVPLDVKRDTKESSLYKVQLTKASILLFQPNLSSDFADPIPGVELVEFRGFPAETSRALEWTNDLAHEALILFTSGTTGNPKGARLSLKNLIVNAEGIKDWLQITDADRFLVNLPLHHINSTTFCLSALLAGASIAIPPAYSNSNFWRQVAKSGATLTSVVQSIIHDQLSRESEFAAAGDVKLRRIQIGSAPVVAHSVLDFQSKYGIPLYQGYGQTETALRVTGVPMDIAPDLYQHMVEENSIGTPMPWADLQVADESGTFLGENTEGELVVRGEAVMGGYVAGEEAFRDGYFLTGDIGYYRMHDGRKFFFLKGRKKEIIIKGGVNISPVAVENSLRRISADIDQAYVIPVFDERYGEEVGAVIVWKEGLDMESAMRALKIKLLEGSEHLSAYETPRYLSSMAASELPMTSTGKVQRTVLKERTPQSTMESVYEFFKTDRYVFQKLTPHTKEAKESHALYNQCWEPLVVDAQEYERNIGSHYILIAKDGAGKIAGQIAFIRTNLSAEELLKTKADEVLSSRVSTRGGKSFVCISICNAGYRPKPVPAISQIPEPDAVLKYLRDGNDPVCNFHATTKGGLVSAELVGVIGGGRAEDKSSCGYAMLLLYEVPTEAIVITPDASVAQQLIEATLLMAQDLDIKNVYAYSRPGGLARFLAK